MKFSEIENFPNPLQKKHRELGDELLHLQVRKQTGKSKTSSLKSIRRDRARIRTSHQAKQN